MQGVGRDGIQPFKVVLIGNSGVGKSSICSRFTTDSFDLQQNPTIAAAFKSKSIQVQGVNLCLNIWDTAGQEKYKSIARMYYRDASAIILVYDITEQNSFKSLRDWYNDVTNNCTYTPVMAVVGNKEDLVMNEVVDARTASQFALSIDAHYTKTSAKSSFGVNQLFEHVGLKCLDKYGSVQIKQEVKLTGSAIRKKKRCC